MRNPYALFLGAHVAACVLAGLGAAALLRRTPARVAWVAAGCLIACAWIDVLRPRTLGFEPRVEYRMLSLRPGADEIAFFEALAQQGNRGPLLEVPIHPKHAARVSKAVLLSAYHLRRTSPCYNSFVPPVTGEVARLASELPDPAALQALARLGFTTIVAHHPDSSGPVAAELHRRLELAAASGAGLRRVYGGRQPHRLRDPAGARRSLSPGRPCPAVTRPDSRRGDAMGPGAQGLRVEPSMADMKQFDFSAFTDPQLLQLHAQVRAEITRRQVAAKRLHVRYGRSVESEGPRYRNPHNSAETWSGRGKRPRWVEVALSRGAPLESLEIDDNRPIPHPRERRRR